MLGCSTTSSEDPAASTVGLPSQSSTVDAAPTTVAEGGAADAGDSSTSVAADNESADDESADADDPAGPEADEVANPLPDCDPGDAEVGELADELEPAVEQTRQEILEGVAACDLDRLLALTDPSALVSDPGTEPVLVVNFGDGEPMDFGQLPFDLVPDLLNGPWSMASDPDGRDIVSFSNGSHEIHLAPDGVWVGFYIVVS